MHLKKYLKISDQFLNSTSDIWTRKIFVVGAAVLCIVGHLAAFLVSVNIECPALDVILPSVYWEAKLCLIVRL